jgi:hypothetical protein
MSRPLPIVKDYPPLIDEIDAAFNVRGKAIFYAWAGAGIYNPLGVLIPPQIHAHEWVHIRRQGDDPVTWWRRYIAEPEFRLREEIPAHRAEWRAYKDRHANERKRKHMLDSIVRRLASPLYGSLIDESEARRLITAKDYDEALPLRRNSIVQIYHGADFGCINPGSVVAAPQRVIMPTAEELTLDR